MYNFKNYFGLDVSQTSIKLCKEQYAGDSSKSFMLYDPAFFARVGNFVKSDVTLSSEVLFHLVEEDVFHKYLNDLFSMAKKAVIIISTDHSDNTNCPRHIKHRVFSDYVSKTFTEWEKVKVELPEGLKADYSDYFHLYVRK